jgi:hypothetical protein
MQQPVFDEWEPFNLGLSQFLNFNCVCFLHSPTGQASNADMTDLSYAHWSDADACTEILDRFLQAHPPTE